MRNVGEPFFLDRRRVTAGRRRTLTRTLSRLVEQLEKIGEGEGTSGLSNATMSRWVDDDYVYLETQLAGTEGSEAGVSIQSGHIFIRIARRGDEVISNERIEHA